MPELLGLVRFMPTDAHEGPFQLPDGRIEIRSRIVSPRERFLNQRCSTERPDWYSSSICSVQQGNGLRACEPRGTVSIPLRDQRCPDLSKSRGRLRRSIFNSICQLSPPICLLQTNLANSGRCPPTKATDQWISQTRISNRTCRLSRRVSRSDKQRRQTLNQRDSTPSRTYRRAQNIFYPARWEEDRFIFSRLCQSRTNRSQRQTCQTTDLPVASMF